MMPLRFGLASELVYPTSTSRWIAVFTFSWFCRSLWGLGVAIFSCFFSHLPLQFCLLWQISDALVSQRGHQEGLCQLFFDLWLSHCNHLSSSLSCLCLLVKSLDWWVGLLWRGELCCLSNYDRSPYFQFTLKNIASLHLELQALENIYPLRLQSLSYSG